MKSILETDPPSCYVCGYGGYLEEHHIFGGPDRKASERYGLKVHLCYNHHSGDDGVHGGNKQLSQKLHEDGQRAFEKNHSRKEFMKQFRRNYLDDSPDTVNQSRQQEGEIEGFTIISDGVVGGLPF